MNIIHTTYRCENEYAHLAYIDGHLSVELSLPTGTGKTPEEATADLLAKTRKFRDRIDEFLRSHGQ
jgi:hypothetical protein